MAKGKSLSVRLEPETRAGLERAARLDKRTLNGMVEKALSEWLEERGHMREAAKPEPAEPVPAPGARERPQRRRRQGAPA